MSAITNIADVIDHRPVVPRQIVIVLLCLVFNMVDGFDITAMSVTAHQIGEEMQIGADRLGLVFSFSLAGMMLGAMFLAGLSDIVGRRTMVLVALVVVGVTVLLTAAVDSLPALILLRFGSGLGAGAMLASVATLAAEYSPEKYRALAVTAVTAGYPTGAMLTGLAASAVIPEFGWRGMFVAGGAATLLLAVVAFFMIPESLQFLCKKQPPDALGRVNRILAGIGRESLGELPEGEAEADGGADDQTIIRKMLSLLTPDYRRTTLILWSAFFLIISTLYVLMSWIPKLIIDLGFDADVGNAAFTLYNLGGVLGIFALGWLASRWMLSSLIGIFSALAAVLMVLFAGAAAGEAGQTALLTLIFVIGLALQGGFTGLYAVAAKVYPVQIRSTGVGWAIGLGRFGAVIGPGIAGYLIAGGFSITANFLTFALPLLAGGVLAYLLRIR